MTNEDLQSKTITWLRFPLAVAIVFVHTVTDISGLSATVSQIDYSQLSSMDIYNLIRFFISNVVARVATPCFCIFSGFLFFYKTKDWNRNIYFQKIKRKTRTLVLPYVLWNIIPVAVMAFILFLKFDGSLSKYMNQLWDNGILKIFWNYYKGDYPYFIPFPYNIPLWFLRDLIIVTFLSPVIYYFVKYTKLFSIFILGTLYFIDIWLPLVSIRALFFFTLGAYYSIHGKNMVMELRKGKWFWFITVIITLFLAMYCNGTDKYHYFHVLFTISGCITIINIASWLIVHGRVSIHPFLSKTSFFIFAAHAGLNIIWNSNQLLNIVFSSNNVLILTMKYFLAPVICVSVCLGLYYAAQKTVPKLLGILTGSR